MAIVGAWVSPGTIFWVAVTTEGQFAFLKAGVQAPLVAQLADKSVSSFGPPTARLANYRLFPPGRQTRHVPAVLHALAATTVLAEAPAGRAAFAPCVPVLTALVAAAAAGPQGPLGVSAAVAATVARAAQRCIDTITWRP